MPSTIRVSLLSLLVFAMTASAQVPSPAIEGPITGGTGAPFVAATSFDPATVGYMLEEYFLTGTASSFTSATKLESDGKWTAIPGVTAPYRTRIVVYRPIKKAKFNGTVLVEWLNVSGGLDAAADWIGAHTELMREGWAYVGVSAQYVGVEGGPALLDILPNPLKTVDPVRYGSLSHPGDSFSFDIFSQAGQALRTPNGPSPLGDLKIKRVIGAGESQSAFRMVTYVNAIHPVAHVYDGFLVHSRGGDSAALSEKPQAVVPAAKPVFIRDDIDVPVLTFQTETDLLFLGSVPARQPDADNIRLWEVAGTSHADTYTVAVGMADDGSTTAGAELYVTNAPPAIGVTCSANINSGPHHFVLKAALHALERWVRSGKPPASMPRLEFVPATGSVPADVARDARGNATGGIRTPQLDVPIASYSGVGQVGSILCLLFGSTEPFDTATLAELYPSSKDYVKAFNKALRAATKTGAVRPKDAKIMKAAAKQVTLGG
ncbi:MAG TPA: alpha/beta hydrolase domain-containing protein [Candidatus Binatia bacterium]|jgi:hypothetical protein|nr:alpha/beta hydrolase domain-containing protein [Candidatus Binatia bacterium]